MRIRDSSSSAIVQLGVLSLCLGWQLLASAQETERPQSAGLSFASLLDEYESQLLRAAATTELRVVDFATREAPKIAQQTFSSNWQAVRSEALRLLSDLPIYDSRKIDQQKWESEFDDVFRVVPSPAHLAAARLWQPTTALNATIMTVLAEHLDREEMANSTAVAGMFGLRTHRTIWRGKPGLVGEYGLWLIAMEYELTNEGMFVPTRAAVARR